VEVLRGGGKEREMGMGWAWWAWLGFFGNVDGGSMSSLRYYDLMG